MNTTEQTEIQLVKKIDQIEAKINGLEKHLLGLQVPTDSDISSIEDATPEQIIQQAQKLAEQQQLVVTRSSEEKIVQRTLKLLGEELYRKKEDLQVLRRSSEFERMQALAHQFNKSIDEALSLLEKMKEIDREIRTQSYKPLGITADLNEAPFCGFYGSLIKVRRRFDVKRES